MIQPSEDSLEGLAARPHTNAFLCRAEPRIDIGSSVESKAPGDERREVQSALSRQSSPLRKEIQGDSEFDARTCRRARAGAGAGQVNRDIKEKILFGVECVTNQLAREDVDRRAKLFACHRSEQLRNVCWRAKRRGTRRIGGRDVDAWPNLHNHERPRYNGR